MRRRQERSECIASVHSNHRPWTANCLSVANWLSVSISAMMLRMRFRRPEVESLKVDWVAGSGWYASTTVAAQACSTAGGYLRARWLWLARRRSYSREQWASDELFKMSNRTACICFQKVVSCLMFKPARLELQSEGWQY